MEDEVRSLLWEAPEHRHIEKSADWYWALGIIAAAGAVASLLFNNVLFSVVILLGATVMMLLGHRTPRDIPYEVSMRGIRINDTLYPYSSLEGYAIDEEAPGGPQLIVKSSHLFGPLLILPLPDEYIDAVDIMLAARLPEEDLSEPLSHRVLEALGF